MTETDIRACPFHATDFAADALDLDPKYEELRRDGTLARITMPHGGDAWLATRHADVRTVFSDPRFSRAATVGKDVPRASPLIQQPESLLSMDPPEHSRLRRLAGNAFSARRTAALTPRIEQLTDGLVDDIVQAGPPADLAGALAWPLAIGVICETLGVPYEDRDTFRTWTDQMMALTVTDPTTIQSARDNLDAYLSDLIAQRRTEGAPTDLLGELVAARDGDDRLTDGELTIYAVDILAAGHETTANLLGNFVYLLLSNRELWEALVADPGLVPGAVEELLRYVPLTASTSIGAFSRVATRDVELAGQLVKAGEAVVGQLDSANRDATVFTEPDHLDFRRADVPHVAFGHGPHYCPGAPLARAELRAAVGTIVRRLPGLRLAVPAGEVEWKTNRVMRGVRELPVLW
jgi:cytochrome P450